MLHLDMYTWPPCSTTFKLPLTLVPAFVQQHPQPLVSAVGKVPPILHDPRAGAHTLPPQAVGHAVEYLTSVDVMGGAQPVPCGCVLQMEGRGGGGHGAGVTGGRQAYAVEQLLECGNGCGTVMCKHAWVRCEVVVDWLMVDVCGSNDTYAAGLHAVEQSADACHHHCCVAE